MNYQPIGYLRTPFKKLAEMPIQPVGARGVKGCIELTPELAEGLKDLDGFSHIIVLYHFHQTADLRLMVNPFLDDHPRGVFATRAPSRPNPIGLSIVRLCKIDTLRPDRAVLEVEDVDMLDKTPLLDIKPYVADFDQPPGSIRSGWLESSASRASDVRSDDRFVATEKG